MALTKRQIEEFRRTIGKRREALLADMDNAETSRDLNEERELEAAQARLEDGSFGSCVHCGLEIGLARLRAVPTAARCVKCQAVHEKTYAHEGEPKL